MLESAIRAFARLRPTRMISEQLPVKEGALQQKHHFGATHFDICFVRNFIGRADVLDAKGERI